MQSNYYKIPKTTQERRKLYDAIDNNFIVRGKRSWKGLVDYRDDKPKSCNYDRCWKRYRKNQYK